MLESLPKEQRGKEETSTESYFYVRARRANFDVEHFARSFESVLLPYLARVPAMETRLSKAEARAGKVEEEVSLLRHLVRKWAKHREWQLEEDTEPALLSPSTEATTQQLIASAQEWVGQIETNFEDLVLRLELVMKVKATFRELWLLARRQGDKYLKQVANMLHDALKNAHAEELTREQVAAVKGILSTVESKPMTIEDAKRVHDALTTVGLEYMPVMQDQE